MAAGYRSAEGLWIGGIGSPQPGGYRSLLAFWIGGATKPSGTQAGYRGFMGIWIGGTNALSASQIIVGGGESPTRRRVARKRKAVDTDGILEQLRHERLLREDEELITILS